MVRYNINIYNNIHNNQEYHRAILIFTLCNTLIFCSIIFHIILFLNVSHDPLNRFYDLTTDCDLQFRKHCISRQNNYGFN